MVSLHIEAKCKKSTTHCGGFLVDGTFVAVPFCLCDFCYSPLVFILRKRLGALDLAGLHAAGADVGLAHSTLGVANRNLLNIGTEGAVGDFVGVADAATGDWVLSADLANFRHLGFSY